MEEGTGVHWLKADGNRVWPGDDVVEIETDRATMAYQAEAAGNPSPPRGRGRHRRSRRADRRTARRRRRHRPSRAMGGCRADHRLLHGADAGAFLADVRARLEEPMRLLIWITERKPWLPPPPSRP
jgi:hypothetical protein